MDCSQSSAVRRPQRSQMPSWAWGELVFFFFRYRRCPKEGHFQQYFGTLPGPSSVKQALFSAAVLRGLYLPHIKPIEPNFGEGVEWEEIQINFYNLWTK